MRSTAEEVVGTRRASKGQHKASKSPHRAVRSKEHSYARAVSHALTSPVHSRGAFERIPNTSDEVILTPKGAKSDPIGKEQDLSSGGPLDDGVAQDFLTPTRKSHPHPTRSEFEYGTNQDLSLRFHLAASNGGQHCAVSNSQRGNLAYSKSYEHSSSSPVQAPGAVRQQHTPRLMTGGLSVRAAGVHSSSPESALIQPFSSAHLDYANSLRASSDVESLVANGDFSESDEQSSAFCTIAADSAMHNRRTVRSHTTQGIPIHMLHAMMGNAAQAHALMGTAEQDCCSENDNQIRDELDAYKDLAHRLEQQVITLRTMLEEERRKTHNLVSNGTNMGLAMETSWYSPSMNQLYRGDDYLDSPGSSAVPSMTMSPDPFSPFQQLTPNASYPGTPACIMYGHPNAQGVQRHRGGSMQASAEDLLPNDAEPYSYLNGLRFDVGAEEGTSELPQLQRDAQPEPIAIMTDGGPECNYQAYPSLQCVSSCQGEGPAPAEAPMRSSACGNENNFDHNGRETWLSEDSNFTLDELIARALATRSQEPSILLQQQLKSATPSRRANIVDALTPHLFRLSDDKHGNFLIQRAVALDSSVILRLRGSYVKLSLAQFGCHVVTRVLDAKEELTKIVVDELLSENVEETLTSRNAVHIWQKILETQWTDSAMRPRIFRVLNDTMRGKWADMAMLETGSIICQNIFESASSFEKSECLAEIVERLCECASNQWGVWVVQHIIEHSEPDSQNAALKELLNDAVELTLSHFGQKAIVSALKTQNSDFIASYVDLLCDCDTTMSNGRRSGMISASLSARRTNLVDIAIVPQGVLIVTQLLTSIKPDQRARIINTVRRNSVFLKSTKPGLNVYRLCERARAYSGY